MGDNIRKKEVICKKKDISLQDWLNSKLKAIKT